MLIEELEDEPGHEALPSLRNLHAAARELMTLVQQALPAADDSANNAAVLPLLLAEPIECVITLAGESATLLSGASAARMTADLERVQNAARKLRALVNETHIPEPPPRLAVVYPPTADAPAQNAASRQENFQGRVLLVDDDEANLELLARRLEREGHEVVRARSGRRALELIAGGSFDVMLLDVVMPEFDGIQTLEQMHRLEQAGWLPVIMLSAMDEVQTAARCLELGADDYLTKPVDPTLLRARLNASLERKRLRDEERKSAEQLRSALREVEEQRSLAESLLRNILPARISDELRSTGRVEPKYFDDISIVFTDFVGFTRITENLAAEELVEMLHDYFTEFDQIVRRYGLEKLKTIGDAYVFIGGLPPRNPSHPVDAVLACFEILDAVERRRQNVTGWSIRVGLHTGPVIAGVVGIEKFAFDVWGETVNYGARMEQCGAPGRVNLSERAFSRVKDFFTCEARGPMALKQEKSIDMFFVRGLQPKLLGDDPGLPPPAFARRYRAYFDRDVPAFPASLAGGPQ